MEGFIESNDAMYDITADDGIRHILWVVDDEEIVKGLTALFDEIPAMYIADGHHRSASACKVGEKRREENPDYTGEEEFNFFMAAIFPGNDLKIFDYNRVVKDLNGNTPDQFLAKVQAAGFAVEELGEEAYYPERKHVFSMYLDNKWYKMFQNLSDYPEIVDCTKRLNNLLKRQGKLNEKE